MGAIGMLFSFVLLTGNNGVALDIGNIELWFCENNWEVVSGGLAVFWNGREETIIGKGRVAVMGFVGGFKMEGMVAFVKNGNDWYFWFWVILSDYFTFETFEIFWLIPNKRGLDFGLRFGIENKGRFRKC